MIKFYKNISDYAKQNWMCRQTAMKHYKEWNLNVIDIPKWSRFIWITIR